MRILFLLIALAGVALGIVYPAVIDTMTGSEIGRFRVYERSGFTKATAVLAEADAPVRAILEMTTPGVYTMPSAAAHLTLTATIGGKTVLAERVVFVSQQPPKDVPSEQNLVAAAGTIDPVTPGPHLFVTALGDVDSLPMRSVDLVLKRNAQSPDQRAQPIGYMLIAIGVIGFILSLSRRGGGKPDEPPKPRWGREAAGGQ